MMFIAQSKVLLSLAQWKIEGKFWSTPLTELFFTGRKLHPPDIGIEATELGRLLSPRRPRHVFRRRNRRWLRTLSRCCGLAALSLKRWARSAGSQSSSCWLTTYDHDVHQMLLLLLVMMMMMMMQLPWRRRAVCSSTDAISAQRSIHCSLTTHRWIQDITQSQQKLPCSG